MDEEERVGWIWCLFFAFAVPEVLSFLRSTRICFFKKVTKPTQLQFWVVFIAETLKTIGTGLLVFMILPTLDVVKGAMITNCLCFVPALLGKASFHFQNGRRLTAVTFAAPQTPKYKGLVSSVGIATRCGLDGPGIESQCRRDFPNWPRPALGPTRMSA